MAFLDAVRDALAPDDTKGREQLDILKKAAMGELNDFLSKFLDRFKNPDGFKEEILPKRMFEQMKQYRVNLDEGASDQIAKIVDTFFGGTEEDLKNGFKEVIKFAFQAILGSTSVGESQTQNWYITIEYGALIRTDIMAWRYNFSSDEVIKASKNAFCYTITKSFVDPETLDEQMLVYFVAT